MQRIEIIKNYFKSWLSNNIDVVKNTFSDDAIYTECYGPVYCGKKEILDWFTDWNREGKVEEWTINRFIENKNTIVVEWFFKCNFKSNISEFNGGSIVDFDKYDKIYRLAEFKSESHHYYPYKNKRVEE